MKHINNLVSDEDIEDASIERQIQKGGGKGKWDTYLSDDEEDDEDFSFNTDDDIGEVSSMSSSDNPWDSLYPSNNAYPQTTEKSAEDKLFDTLKEGAKGTKDFIKEFIEAAKQTDIPQRVAWGRVTIITSTILSIVGLLLGIFQIKIGWGIMIGSLLSLATGLIIFGIAYDKLKKMDNKVDYMNTLQNNGYEEVEEDELDLDADEEELDLDSESEEDTDNIFDDDKEILSKEADEDDEEIDWSKLDLGKNKNEEDVEDIDEDENEEKTSRRGEYREVVTDSEYSEIKESNLSDTLSKVSVIDRNTVTRSFLYEQYVSVFPTVTPKYNRVEDYDEDTREFAEYAALVKKAALLVSKKDAEDLPMLLKLTDKALYTKMVVSRSNAVNFDKFIKELQALLSYDTETDETDDNLYITGRVVGSEWILKVFTGETLMISIGDCYNDPEVKKFVLNPKNKIPLVLGINEEGKVVYTDIEEMNALLITGMPRSGKSWFALTVLTQLTMFMKPSELEIYMVDPKSGTSDFKDFMPPHVKSYVSDIHDIVNLLKRLIDVEAKKRTELFETQNVKKIQDWNAKNPLNPCPYIYVYIDEVIALAEEMKRKDKELLKQFQSMLLEITTRLPSLGIRPILVPHVVKNQFLDKSITDNIPCRISVKGDAEHIAACVGEDDPPFTYKLTHKGDMAVMLTDNHIRFVHSVIVTPKVEDNITVFEYLRQLWSKLEPDSVATSCYYKREHGLDVTKVDTGIKKQIESKTKKVAINGDEIEKNSKAVKSASGKAKGIELSKFMKEEEEDEEDIDLDDLNTDDLMAEVFDEDD